MTFQASSQNFSAGLAAVAHPNHFTPPLLPPSNFSCKSLILGKCFHLQADTAGNGKAVLVLIVELKVMDKHLVDPHGMAGRQTVQLGLKGGGEELLSNWICSLVLHS